MQTKSHEEELLPASPLQGRVMCAIQHCKDIRSTLQRVAQNNVHKKLDVTTTVPRAKRPDANTQSWILKTALLSMASRRFAIDAWG